MKFSRSLWVALAMAPALALFLGVPARVQAADPAKHVKCEVTKSGKTETKEVASADECTKMGGKVAEEKKKK